MSKSQENVIKMGGPCRMCTRFFLLVVDPKIASIVQIRHTLSKELVWNPLINET